MTSKKAFRCWGAGASLVLPVALVSQRAFPTDGHVLSLGESLIVILLTYACCGIALAVEALLSPMTVRISSFILASFYTAIGILIFFSIPKFVAVYNDILTDVPVITSVVLAVRPLGWLLISLIASALVLAKDISPRSRRINWLLSFVLVAGVAFIGYALFHPIYVALNTPNN